MELLKFVTCGSVDDGKSTLIGHMLYSAKLIFADQKQALELDSKVGSAGGAIDYSLLLDGLEAEREQGITIDVAYRFFTTEKRSFIVADCPGHAEYTRNMAVGASFADAAVILLDVTKGVLTQTRRHFRICNLMGIRDFIFVVNKMDLVSYQQEKFRAVQEEILKMTEEITGDIGSESQTDGIDAFPLHSFHIIPVSATKGDNILKNSECMPWYDGTPLLPLLETVRIERMEGKEFCMPVQRVSRPNASFRGYQGEVAQGELQLGDELMVLPSGERANVCRLLVSGKDTAGAAQGDPVSLCLDREIDISRGCVLANPGLKLHVGRSFAAYLLWMNDTDMGSQNRYRLKIGTMSIPVSIRKIKHRIDIDSGKHLRAVQLARNDLAVCELETSIPIVFDEFRKNRNLGGFILIDPVTNATAACGTVLWALGEEGKPKGQELSINRTMREKLNAHRAMTIWFTGLSGAGKTTLADSVEKELYRLGIHTMILDGDNVRLGLCRDLGFSEAERRENIRRVAETAKLLNEAGSVVLCCFVSPTEEVRRMAAEIVGREHFMEIFVNASLDTCIKRDTKGLYKKALRGEIRDFTGISSSYEIPINPDMTIDTNTMSITECRDRVLSCLMQEITKQTNDLQVETDLR